MSNFYRVMTRKGLLLLTPDEFERAARRGVTITRNRRGWTSRLAFRVAGLLTHLPYTKRLSLWVDRIVIYAEGIR